MADLSSIQSIFQLTNIFLFQHFLFLADLIVSSFDSIPLATFHSTEIIEVNFWSVQSRRMVLAGAVYEVFDAERSAVSVRLDKIYFAATHLVPSLTLHDPVHISSSNQRPAAFLLRWLDNEREFAARHQDHGVANRSCCRN